MFFVGYMMKYVSILFCFIIACFPNIGLAVPSDLILSDEEVDQLKGRLKVLQHQTPPPLEISLFRRSPLGVRADDPNLNFLSRYHRNQGTTRSYVSRLGVTYNRLPKQGPEVYLGLPETISSVNGKGDFVFKSNYVTLAFHQFISTKRAPVVLDLGAGVGHHSYRALKKGATVIATDMEPAHLALLRGETCEHYRNRLYLMDGVFPEFDFPENSLDAVLMSHVAHYMSGRDIERGFQKIYSWLKPEGRLFFLALTPFSRPFRRLFQLPLKMDVPWPNEIEDYGAMAESVYEPRFIDVMVGFAHPLYPHSVKRAAEDTGFFIRECNYGTFDQWHENPHSLREIEARLREFLAQSEEGRNLDELKDFLKDYELVGMIAEKGE